MSTATPRRDWQAFYSANPVPDPHALAASLVARAKAARTSKLPLQLGVANVLVLAAGVAAAFSL